MPKRSNFTRRFRDERMLDDLVVTISPHDREAIRDVLSAYGHAFDSGEGDWFASLFFPDGRCTVRGREVRGHDALRSFAIDAAERNQGKLRHLVANELVTIVSQDEVDVLAYGLVSKWGESPELRMFATYRARLARSGGAWKIKAITASPP
jgi:uncharacterized protein (TIGR02246 family)